MEQDIKEIHIEQDAYRAEAENIFYERKRRVQIHVEGYEDIPFWYIVFKRYAPGLNLEFIPYTRRMQPDGKQKFVSGKDILLKIVRENEKREEEKTKVVGPDKLICVDSDYDYLLPDTPDGSIIRDNHPYIFQTYVHSIENYKCLAESLDGICVEATYHSDTELGFDFVKFLREFSNKIYDLFLYFIYSRKYKVTNPITLDQFCQIINLGGKQDIRNNATKALQKLEDRIAKEIKKFRERNPGIDFDKAIPVLAAELKKLGVTCENTYLFIKGHTLFESVVYPIMDCVVCKLIGNKYKQILDKTLQDSETAHHLRAEYERLIYKSKRQESLPKSIKMKSKKKNKEMIYHPKKLIQINKEFYHYNSALLNKIKEDIAQYLRRHPVS